MSIFEISQERRAVLDRVAIQGATHASSTLSRLFQREVKIYSDGFESVPIDEACDLGLPSDQELLAVHNRIQGEVEGNVLLAFPVETAFELVEVLMGGLGAEPAELGDMECSALMETGNITASAFIGSLGTALGCSLLPGVPTLLHDVGGAILAPMLIEQLLASNQALMSQARFEFDERAIDWWLHVMPTPESLPVMEELLQ
ncbi:MAG: hypothetical protein CSA62_14900 [Planctomycetota bacterium]|nr:MAG: hypothetical protein CSA62_14900 [Planctomycetota bacterium]